MFKNYVIYFKMYIIKKKDCYLKRKRNALDTEYLLKRN